MADAPPPAPGSETESEGRRFWESRRLPPRSGTLGPSDGPIRWEFEGTFLSTDAPTLVVPRALLADVDARYLAVAGRRGRGLLRREGTAAGAEPGGGVPRLIERLGIWVGGPDRSVVDVTERTEGVQTLAGRLARKGLLVARDAPIRVCLTCASPRSPDRIIYQQEIGDTFLVRFPIAGTEPAVDALVWVDAPWRLLGTSALLVHPDLEYVTVEYHRRDVSAVLLTSRSSLARLQSWLPEIQLEVRDAKPGRDWAGRPYAYPLRHEFPMGGTLTPPAGTIQPVADVGDSGTGIVPLVPGHGGTDAQIADRLGVSGWPLLTSSGLLDLTLMHKYSGLDLETANEFVARDLTEGGSVFARLRVMRGVPYCGVCGHAMVWIPGRAWCLEPSHLPREQTERFARLLPHERPISQIEVAPWVASEMAVSRAPDAVTLLECTRCARLDAPDGPATCPCGGHRHPVARRLLPSIQGALAAWAGGSEISPADTARVYANERRRAPVLVHHLVALTALEHPITEVGLTVVPTLPDLDLAALLDRHGSDAVRSALVRATRGEGRAGMLEEIARQERTRLEGLAALGHRLVEGADPTIVAVFRQPVVPGARDLEPEDRAILARWAFAHLRALAAYDRGDARLAHRELWSFVDRDLREYAEFAGARLAAPGLAPPKRSAARTLAHVLRSVAADLAPIAPHTAEALRRPLVGEARSVFEGVDLATDRLLADEAQSAAWEQWRGLVRSLEAFRRRRKIPATTVLPSAALLVPDEALATRLRAQRATIERLANVARIDVAGPESPWGGLNRRIVPIESEIQRAYPSMAPQILHLMRRLPVRKAGEAPGKELTVFVHGVPRVITPSMVRTVDTLPDRYVAAPSALGPLYVELPPGVEAAPAELPPLSADAFWLVRRVQQRLRQGGAFVGPRVAIVSAVDPLAAELREKAPALASALGLGELRVTERAEQAAPFGRITGRTRTGARWWVDLPGVGEGGRRSKQRASRALGRRVPDARTPSSEGAVDYADETVQAEAQAIRDLGQELDTLLAAPLLGPTKVAIAWAAGYRQSSDFGRDPFDELAALPGFGRPVAGALWTKLGRTPPSSPRRRVLARPRPTAAAPPRPPPPGPAAVRPPASAPAVAPPPPPPTVVVAPELPAAPVDSAPSPTVEEEPLPPAEPPFLGPREPAVAAPEPAALEIPPEAPAEPTAIAELPAAELAVRPEGALVPTDLEGPLPTEPEPSSAGAIDDASGAPPALAADFDPPPAEPLLPPVESPPEPEAGSSGLPEAPPEPVDGPERTAESAPPATPVEPPEIEGAGRAESVEPPAAGIEAVDPTDTLLAIPEVPPAEPPPALEPVRPSSELPAAPPPAPPEADGPAVAPAEVPSDSSGSDTVEPTPADPAPEASPDGSTEVPAPPAPEIPVAAEVVEALPSEAAVAPEPPVLGDATPVPAEPTPSPEAPAAPTPPELGPQPPSPEGPLTVPTIQPDVPAVAPTPEVPPPPAAPVPVAPPPPPPPPPPEGVEVDQSYSLLAGLQPFLDATAAGHRGIAIVRDLPERVLAHVGPRPVEVYWLSSLGRGRTLRPSDLDGIGLRVRQAIADESVRAVFLEGIEYLVRIHGTERVVGFLRDLDAAARAHHARLWVHLTPSLLSESETERLVGFASDPAPPAPDAPPSG